MTKNFMKKNIVVPKIVKLIFAGLLCYIIGLTMFMVTLALGGQ